MRNGRFSGLVAIGLIAAVPGWAQSRDNERAESNVRQSRQYESLVCSNPAFRAKRIAQECGPISDPELHQSCMASFDCGGPRRATHFRKAPPSETIR